MACPWSECSTLRTYSKAGYVSFQTLIPGRRSSAGIYPCSCVMTGWFPVTRSTPILVKSRASLVWVARTTVGTTRPSLSPHTIVPGTIRSTGTGPWGVSIRVPVGTHSLGGQLAWSATCAGCCWMARQQFATYPLASLMISRPVNGCGRARSTAHDPAKGSTYVVTPPRAFHTVSAIMLLPPT